MHFSNRMDIRELFSRKRKDDDSDDNVQRDSKSLKTDSDDHSNEETWLLAENNVFDSENEGLEDEDTSGCIDDLLKELNQQSPVGGETNNTNADSLPQRPEQHNVVRPPGPVDISQSSADGPTQPKRKKSDYKLTDGRRFNPDLFKQFKWLEYSVYADRVYCFTCRHFHGPDGAFVSDGFNNWKKLSGSTTKENRLLRHKSSESHVRCTEAFNSYRTMSLGGKTVIDMLDSGHREMVAKNRRYIKTIIDILRLTAVQNLAQRGHRERSSEGNRGNFLELLHFLSKYSEELKRTLESNPSNAKYTHHSIQNAILECMSELILGDIKEEIDQSTYCSVMADETKDLSKKEQLAIVVRYLFEGNIHEEFVGLVVAEELNAEALCTYIREVLAELKIPAESIVAQGYDGASVMSGQCNGVQEKLRQFAKKAVYIHCYNHCLNLIIVASVNGVTPVADFFCTIQQAYKFLSGSAVHPQWLKFQENMYPDKPTIEFKSFSDTRWASQIRAVAAIKSRFTCFVNFLRHVEIHEKNRERATTARALLSQINQTFIYVMLIMYDVLNETKKASDTFQNPKIDFCAAANYIEALIDILTGYRTSENAGKYFEESRKVALENELKCVTAQEKRTSIPTKSMDEYVILSSVGKQQKITDSAGMRAHILYPVMDMMLGEMNRRFNADSLQILRSLSAIDPRSEAFLDSDVIKPFADFYELNFSDIQLEFRQIKRMIARSGKQLLNLMDLHDLLQPLELAFTETCTLIAIALTLPISTAGVERMFSKLLIIKGKLRTTMGDSRLKALMMLSVHRERAMKLDLDRVVDTFIAKFPNTRLVLC